MVKEQIFFLIAIVSICSARVYEDDYSGVLQEVYFGRNPSAMSEALGKGGVALSNGVFSPFYNPACLALNQGLIIGGSYAEPYYMANNASYIFGGLSYTINDKATIGLQTNNFYLGEKFTVINGLGAIINSFYSRSSFYTLTLSTKLIDDFMIGCNFSYVYNKMAYNDGGATGFPIDIGIAKTIDFNQEKNITHSIILGASLSNIFDAKIFYYANEKYDLPVIFRIGSSYQITLSKTNDLSHYFHFLSHFEYCNVLNSDYYTSYKWGSEFSLSRLLLLRIGYYWESENDYGLPDYNKNHLDDITYGIGLFLPFSIIKRNHYYPTIKFDFTTLKQPTATKIFDNWDNFHSFSLLCSWDIKNK